MICEISGTFFVFLWVCPFYSALLEENRWVGRSRALQLWRESSLAQPNSSKVQHPWDFFHPPGSIFIWPKSEKFHWPQHQAQLVLAWLTLPHEWHLGLNHPTFPNTAPVHTSWEWDQEHFLFLDIVLWEGFSVWYNHADKQSLSLDLEGSCKLLELLERLEGSIPATITWTKWVISRLKVKTRRGKRHKNPQKDVNSMNIKKNFWLKGQCGWFWRETFQDFLIRRNNIY